MGLVNSLEDTSNAVQNSPAVLVDMSLDEIDDDEIDTYIMSENEYQKKNGLWHEMNAPYLEEQKSKCEFFLLRVSFNSSGAKTGQSLHLNGFFMSICVNLQTSFS